MGVISGLVGCQKDADIVQDPTNAEVDVTPRLRAFISRAEHANDDRDETVITIDSAEWYIEGAINLNVAQAWIEYNDHAVDSILVSIPVVDGAVLGNSATSKFLELKSLIEGKLTEGENHLILADVNFGIACDGLIPVFVLLEIGSGYDRLGGLITSYGANDFWIYGGPLPNCGCGPNAGAPGGCANYWIRQRINATLGLLAGCYYTNLQTAGVNWTSGGATQNFYSQQFPTGIPATPYKIYYCYNAFTCDNCLDPSRMTFYTQSTYAVMQQLTPSQKVPVSVATNFVFVPNGADAIYSQSYLFSYGKLNCPK